MIRRNLFKFNNILLKKLEKNDVKPIYLKLSLNDFDINIESLNRLRLSYNNLPIDTYYPDKKIIPNRFRRYSSFNIKINKNKIKINKLNNNVFNQEVDDFRNKSRYFEPIEDHIINNELTSLFIPIISLVHYYESSIKQIIIDVHQVRLLSYNNQPSDNAPEGIHQDGADYIISALVLNKYNIKNDHSIIYDKNKKELYRTNLNLGEFIFQDDKNLWHDITPLKAIENYNGYRDILGFDIKLKH